MLKIETRGQAPIPSHPKSYIFFISFKRSPKYRAGQQILNWLTSIFKSQMHHRANSFLGCPTKAFLDTRSDIFDMIADISDIRYREAYVIQLKWQFGLDSSHAYNRRNITIWLQGADLRGQLRSLRDGSVLLVQVRKDLNIAPDVMSQAITPFSLLPTFLTSLDVIMR